MTTALTTTAPAPLAATQRTDASIVGLFLATKRSIHTRISYRHSIDMLLGELGKPLAAVTLEDAVTYHYHLRQTYASLHSIKLHINVAKSLFAFAVSLNYLVTNVFAPIKPDATPEITHKRILTEEEVLRIIDAPRRER